MTKTHATPGSPFSTRHALIVAGLLIGGSLILVWMFAPLEDANLLAVASLGSTVLVVVARAFHGRTRGQRA
jgi:hypothetical protein